MWWGVIFYFQLAVETKSGGATLNNQSHYFNNVSRYYDQQSKFSTNIDLHPHLMSLSSNYKIISNKLTESDRLWSSIKTNRQVIHTDVSSMINHFTSLQEKSNDLLNNINMLRQRLGNTSDVEQIFQITIDRFMAVGEVFVERSMSVLRTNFGRCGHIAFIYSVISQVCFFAATRWVLYHLWNAATKHAALKHVMHVIIVFNFGRPSTHVIKMHFIILCC